MDKEDFDNLKELIGSAKTELIKAYALLSALRNTTDLCSIEPGLNTIKDFVENADEIISIPMRGEINSLNASVSAAILIYGIGE